MTIGINGELHERRRQVYICKEANLFLVTGTACKAQSSRKAYVDIVPFYTLGPKAHELLLQDAQDYTASSSQINLSYEEQGQVVAFDKLCQTTSRLQLDKKRLSVWQEHDKEGADRPYLDKLRAQSREYVLKL